MVSWLANRTLALLLTAALLHLAAYPLPCDAQQMENKAQPSPTRRPRHFPSPQMHEACKTRGPSFVCVCAHVGGVCSHRDGS